MPQLHLQHQLSLVLLKRAELAADQLRLRLLGLVTLDESELEDLAADVQGGRRLAQLVLGLGDPLLQLREVVRRQVSPSRECVEVLQILRDKLHIWRFVNGLRNRE